MTLHYAVSDLFLLILSAALALFAYNTAVVFGVLEPISCSLATGALFGFVSRLLSRSLTKSLVVGACVGFLIAFGVTAVTIYNTYS